MRAEPFDFNRIRRNVDAFRDRTLINDGDGTVGARGVSKTQTVLAAFATRRQDGNEDVTLPDQAAVLFQSVHRYVTGDHGKTVKQCGQGHGRAHGVTALAAAAGAFVLLLAASQLCKSSGGTSSKRSAPSMTLRNTGAETVPP